MKLSVYTDASRSGPWLGLAAVLVADGDEITARSVASQTPAKDAVTLAEFAAVTMGLSLVKRESRHLIDLTLYSDNRAVVHALAGEHPCRSAPNAQRHALRLVEQYRSVEFRWVKGHNGDQHNERANDLAVKARWARAGRRLAR